MADERELTGNGAAIILVVDRDSHVRELELHFLNQAGFSVEFEHDGGGALEQARRLQPEIVITEILVPKLDGSHFAASSRRILLRAISPFWCSAYCRRPNARAKRVPTPSS